MAKDILNWEACLQIEEAIVDGLSDEQLQSILDVIYGKNMFTVINAEVLKKRLYVDKEVLGVLNKSEVDYDNAIELY